MKAKVYITLRKSVLDPQGVAVSQALSSMGFNEVQSVRLGKYIEIDLNTQDKTQAEKRLAQMSQKLLANTVIEDYKIEIV